MKEEFVISRQGREMVLYGGLLDAAHQQGLASIDTELIQVPTDENGNVAICKATVEMADPDDFKIILRKFSGIGDASPDNVSRNIVPHIIRMAETRSKARALRDATNIHAALLEDESTHEEDHEDLTPGGASSDAANYLEGLLIAAGHDEKKVKERVPHLSANAVSKKIQEYKPIKEQG